MSPVTDWNVILDTSWEICLLFFIKIDIEFLVVLILLLNFCLNWWITVFCALVEDVINSRAPMSEATRGKRCELLTVSVLEPLFSVAVEPGLQRLLENPFAAHLLHVRVDYGIHSSWNIIWLVRSNLSLCGMLWCTEHNVTFDRSLPQFILSSLCAAVTWPQVSMVPGD